MSALATWPIPSPNEVSPPIWLPGLSLSSQNTNAASFSKARLQFSARSRLAPLKAGQFLLFFLCCI